MIKIAPPMILLGILLIINAFSMDNHPILMFFDLAAAAWLLWNSISRDDPPMTLQERGDRLRTRILEK